MATVAARVAAAVDDDRSDSASSGLNNRSSSNNEDTTSRSGSMGLGGTSGGSGSGNDSIRSGSTSNNSGSLRGRTKTLMQDTLKNSSNFCTIRAVMVILFVVMAIYVPILVYRVVSANQMESFERVYDDLATKIIDSFQFRMAQKLQALDSIDISMTVHAGHTSTTSYPKITMPDFDLSAANTLALAGTAGIWFVPKVNESTENSGGLRQEWEQYSVANQDWISTALNRDLPQATTTYTQERHRHRSLNEDEWQGWEDNVVTNTEEEEEEELEENQNQQQVLDGIATHISQYGSDGTLIAKPPGTGPYYPIWQNAPAYEGIVNVDLLSIGTFKNGIEALDDSKLAVLDTIMDFSQSEKPFQAYMDELVATLNSGDHTTEPISMLFYPVFESFNNTSSSTSVSGMFAMTVYWHSFFEGVLPSNAEGLVCVVENSCGQAFTYRINGQSTVLEGYGDVHDGSFEDLAKTLQVNSDVQTSDSVVPLDDKFCPYTLTVYPSQELEDEFLTYRPALFTIVIAIVFVLILAIAITYDCVVQRRLKAVLNNALESRAIISSLFPENVRERLFQEDQEKQQQRPKQKEILFGEQNNNNDQYLPAKLRLKTFVDESPSAAGATGGGGSTIAAATTSSVDASAATNNNELTILQSKPIADLFPNCTVLFSDIAGFTAWSSEREPAQVFTLLQTIFHYFDNIAKKWGVFKVETIGDCYVAVTGLPDPQEDHAVRMAKFAREALRIVTGLTHKLETTLGPGTGDLTMRFGLHSGPVTAGVLRGEKSRFQLFGDTVNLASRMENTGKKGYIQVSATTAELLMKGGKSAWLSPREDLVTAKGKGSIQTYWVSQSSKRSGEEKQSSRRPSGFVGGAGDGKSAADALGSKTSEISRVSRISEEDGPKTDIVLAKRVLEARSGMQNRKYQRLIDWQTEILGRLLKSIVAHRGKKNATKFVANPAGEIAKNQVGKDCVLDEVAEIMRLPDFDEKKTQRQMDNPNTVELSPAAMTQLKDYVTIICSRYKLNPFHNFEHASHVTMSASKLLSRIVAPENINYQTDNKKDLAAEIHDYTYGITSDPLTQFAAIFCSLIHDVDHQGVSNFQLGSEQPDIAQKYKNRSLAEQNSVDIAWDLLLQPEFRNLQQCIFATEEELQRFRQLVVNLVMATDIFDKPFKDLRNSRWERAFHDKDNEVSNDDRFDLRSTIVIEHIIQAADVAHTMQHWHVYTKWNERLFQEMYLAYENGRSPKDPSLGWYNGELWFFDNYVIPLGKKLDECNVFGVASDEGLNYALANRAEWAIKGEEIVQDMVRRYKEQKPAKEESKEEE